MLRVRVPLPAPRIPSDFDAKARVTPAGIGRVSQSGCHTGARWRLGNRPTPTACPATVRQAKLRLRPETKRRNGAQPCDISSRAAPSPGGGTPLGNFAHRAWRRQPSRQAFNATRARCGGGSGVLTTPWRCDRVLPKPKAAPSRLRLSSALIWPMWRQSRPPWSAPSRPAVCRCGSSPALIQYSLEFWSAHWQEQRSHADVAAVDPHLLVHGTVRHASRL